MFVHIIHIITLFTKLLFMLERGMYYNRLQMFLN